MNNARLCRLFKNPAGKAQKKFKDEAYLFIREGLNFLQQRSQRAFFNSLMYREKHRVSSHLRKTSQKKGKGAL